MTRRHARPISWPSTSPTAHFAELGRLVARFEVTCAADQIYLRPDPKELMFRNHL